MLKIRLKPVGRKHDRSFRVVVTDSKKGISSDKYIEMVGSYDPRTNRVDLKPERITHWISGGAQPSDTVHNLLVGAKVIEGKKINVLPKKTPIVKEVVEAKPASAPVVPVEEKTDKDPPPETPPALEAPLEEASPEVIEEKTKEPTQEEAPEEELTPPVAEEISTV